MSIKSDLEVSFNDYFPHIPIFNDIFLSFSYPTYLLFCSDQHQSLKFRCFFLLVNFHGFSRLVSCYPVKITLKPVPNFQLALASVSVCVCVCVSVCVCPGREEKENDWFSYKGTASYDLGRYMSKVLRLDQKSWDPGKSPEQLDGRIPSCSEEVYLCSIMGFSLLNKTQPCYER